MSIAILSILYNIWLISTIDTIGILVSNMLSYRLFIPYFLWFPISSDYIFTLIYRVFGTRVGIIDCHSHPLVVEPSKILLLTSLSLDAD